MPSTSMASVSKLFLMSEDWRWRVDKHNSGNTHSKDKLLEAVLGAASVTNPGRIVKVV